MQKIIGYISFTLGVVLLALALIAGRTTESADTVKFVGGTTYRLAGSGVTLSADTITLTSFTIPQTGQDLFMSDFGTILYGTIEPGNITKQEFVSCTGITQNANGTATLTGCSRGLAPVSPYTASSTLRFSHAGGSTFIISNPPQLYDETIFKDNDATSTGKHVWASTTPPGYDFVPANHQSGAIVASTSEFASMAALNAVVASGCLDASTSNQGCVEIATANEAGSSTPSGSQALLVLPASMATTTPQNCTSLTSCVVMSIGNKIRQTWLDLTESFSWTGNHTWTGNATSSIFAVHNTLYVGNSGTTTISGSSTATSSFRGYLDILGAPGSNATSTIAAGLRVNTFQATATTTLTGCRGCLSGHKVVSASLGNLDGGSPSSASATISCPDGQVVTGGGINSGTLGASADADPFSYPSGTTGWTGTVYGGNGSTADSGSTVYAICVYP